MRMLLSRAEYAKHARPQGDLTVQTEWRFTVRDGDSLLSGQIDRLVLVQRSGQPVAADVVDFKTDRPRDAAALAERVEFYRPQQQAYRQAVAHVYSLPPSAVTTRLVFLRDRVVVDVDSTFRGAPG
jgi:ATP-dependent exoDNAse (exonuclease V) beta subunit